MTPYNFAILLFSFCSLMLGFLIWWKRQDSVGHKYLLFSIFASLWGVFFAIMISSNISYASAHFVGKIANAFAALIGPAWYHFAIVYSESKTRLSKLFLKTAYGIGITVVLFSFSPWFIPRMGPIGAFNHYPFPGPFYVCYTILFLMCVCFAFIELIHTAQKCRADEKMATLGLVIASLFGFIGGSLTFLPIYRIDFPQYGMFIMPFNPLIISYFISRQNLFSLESVALAAHQQKLIEMGILSASINHELKNPLYIIQTQAESFLERRKEGVLADSTKAALAAEDCLRSSRDQAERAFKIVSRLTSFVRQKTFTSPVFAAVPLPEVLESLLPLLHHELMSNNIVLKQDFPKESSVVYTDRGALEEILFNLLLNSLQALKLAHSREGEIHIRTLKLEGHMEIQIEDNGPGISHEDLKKIFKPFYTTKEQGVGLGLYITSRLAERLGAKLSAKQAPFGGAIFVLEFVLCK